MRFEISRVLDTIERRLTTDPAVACGVVEVGEVVRYCAAQFTLEPGDVIATGTPAGVGAGRDPQVWLQDGDVVEVEIGDAGVLRNPVSRPS